MSIVRFSQQVHRWHPTSVCARTCGPRLGHSVTSAVELGKLYHAWYLHASKARASTRPNWPDRARFMTLFQLTRPLLGMVDAETAHRLTLAALRLGVVPPGDVVDSLALAVNLPACPSPTARPCRRLRQECRGHRSHAEAGLRLCRSRIADAATAGRQPAPASVSPSRGSRDHQPPRLQQWRP